MKARNKTGLKPLKFNETAKSEISRTNDSKGLRIWESNVFLSHAKFLVPFAKLFAPFGFGREMSRAVAEAAATVRTSGFESIGVDLRKRRTGSAIS